MGAAKPKPRVKYRYRSSVTGRYVSPAFAAEHPRETVREQVKPRGRPC